MKDNNFIENKIRWVWEETLKLHGRSMETRVASSLSCIDLLVVLYYNQFIKYKADEPLWEDRDRFIISKGHGSISYFPILADLNFFPMKELEHVSESNRLLKAIPDNLIPGYETINGSLGHGINVGCGISIALRARRKDNKVIVLCGDGELNEGSNWEGIMFAGHHQLDNMFVIIDNNKGSMLDFSKNIINLEPFEEKFQAFGWESYRCNGHNIEELNESYKEIFSSNIKKPKVLIADTIKGKGVPQFEVDPLSHIKSLNWDDINSLIKDGVHVSNS